MKEIIIYAIAAVASLFIFGYSIHMFIGGLVSEETEIALITLTCLLAAGVIAFMVRDVINRRRQADEQ